jgi:hypothetical protein
MNATSTQTQPDAAQQHDIAIDMAAAETCRRSPNKDSIDTSLLAAKLYAKRGADSSSLPQTIFRTADTAGWWHTHCHARVLEKAEVFATILPARYFQ